VHWLSRIRLDINVTHVFWYNGLAEKDFRHG